MPKHPNTCTWKSEKKLPCEYLGGRVLSLIIETMLVRLVNSKVLSTFGL